MRRGILKLCQHKEKGKDCSIGVCGKKKKKKLLLYLIQRDAATFRVQQKKTSFRAVRICLVWVLKEWILIKSQPISISNFTLFTSYVNKQVYLKGTKNKSK